MDAARLLRLLAGHLSGPDVPWAVAGGFALNALGYARFTRDLDVLVDEAGRVPLLEGLVDDGFEVLFASEGFANLLHTDAALGRLDLLFVEGETSRRIFGGCRQVPGPGSVPVLVPRPEHLVAMKVAAIANDPGRGLRDLADVLFLLRLPGIDDNEVRGYFERRGLIETWEQLQRLR